MPSSFGRAGLLGAALLLTALGCSPEPSVPPRDGGAEDGGALDAGAPDAGDSGEPPLPSDGGQEPPDGGRRAMWIWDRTVALDAGARSELLAFAEERAIDTVYLSAGALLQSARPALAEFIVAAHDAGVAVELLFGDPNWSKRQNHANGLARVQSTLDFARDAGVRPDGVHLDVEPHVLAEWKDGGADALSVEYLEFLGKAAALTGPEGLRLSADIAYWYDARWVSIDGGAPQPLSTLALERVDRAVVMAYRDYTGTCGGAPLPDGVVWNARDEVAQASDAGKEVIVAVETKCGEPDKVSFWEEGLPELEKVLAATECAFAGQPSFAGVAIHQYDSFRRLAIREQDGGFPPDAGACP